MYGEIVVPKTPVIMKRKAKEIVSTQSFFYTILALVVLNMFLLILNGYSSSFNATYNKINVYFAIIFLVEMLTKIFAYGLTDYLRNREHLLESFIAITSIIDLAANSSFTNMF